MGHTRLGELPRTRKWQQVVGLIANGAGAAQVANATMTAAQAGLKFAAQDAGVVEAVWLLTQIPLAARTDDFAENLRQRGIEVSQHPSLMEIVGAFSDAVDHRLSQTKGRTDLGEMAQMAGAETIAEVLGSRTQGLFGTTARDVQQAFSDLATNKQFGNFSRKFFTRLTEKYLDYFLSRALSHHLGEGQRFTTLAQQAEFTDAMRLHCRQASLIVEEFSGGWFSKTNWEQKGISREASAGFVHIAMKKMSAELQQGAQTDE